MHYMNKVSSTPNGSGPDTADFPAGGVTERPAIELAPAWRGPVEESRHRRNEVPGPARIIPLSPEPFLGRITVVTNTSGAHSLVNLAKQRPLVCVGIDFEFRHATPGVFMRRWKSKDLFWHDPRSVVPLLLAVVLLEAGPDGRPRHYRAVVDCRGREAVLPLADLFRLPVPFVGHHLRAELICLWALGLPAPDTLWDSWVAEKALQLGLHHARYKNDHPQDEAEEAAAKEEAEEVADLACDLPATCTRRGVVYPFAADKARLQQSFLTHPDGAPFTREQIDYNAADAEAAAGLYLPQAQAAAVRGCLHHLLQVEMPWTAVCARLHWDGVRVDAGRCRQLLGACDKHEQQVGAELHAMGLGNVNSHPQLRAFFEKVGLLDPFRVRGGYSFSDDRLEAAEARHPAIPRIRLLRKIRRLRADKALTGELVGADGRLHPEHRQLGAESGRNAMRWPNVGGIGRALRPVVVPEEGHGVGEVDLCQIEVGIAAAVYNDSDLIRMFNGRDVYTRMAKNYFAAELPSGAAELPDKQFKKQYGSLRDRMKVFVLAIIYNITPFGLALRLGITPEQAAVEQQRFLGMFPALSTALREASAYGVIRGFAYLCSGLRRWRAGRGHPTSWETNWMRNTPVQGSASIVFKTAGNRLYRRYQHYGARLVLPMHDAFVFEAPLEHLEAVAAVTGEVLKGSVQEWFPALDPQVDVNIGHAECWNKDGRFNSLRQWAEDPAYAV
jgi:DNA polymerase-1